MGLFMGLTCIYLSDIQASLGASAPGLSRLGTRLMGSSTWASASG
jgi:hypothetical protein